VGTRHVTHRSVSTSPSSTLRGAGARSEGLGLCPGMAPREVLGLGPAVRHCRCREPGHESSPARRPERPGTPRGVRSSEGRSCAGSFPMPPGLLATALGRPRSMPDTLNRQGMRTAAAKQPAGPASDRQVDRTRGSRTRTRRSWTGDGQRTQAPESQLEHDRTPDARHSRIQN
jgi:hypothetical protein